MVLMEHWGGGGVVNGRDVLAKVLVFVQNEPSSVE
jgi:hypothetical protein